MYCSQLLDIKKISSAQAEKLDVFLKDNLKSDYISISACFRATQIPIETLADVFSQLCMIGFLDLIYAIRCPECGHLIKQYENQSDIINIVGETTSCYLCDEEIELKKSDIVALFKRNDKSPFFKGQRQKLMDNKVVNDVAHEDYMEYLIKINKTFSDLIELERDKYISQKEQSERIAIVQRKAYAIYVKRKKIYDRIKVVTAIVNFGFLLVLLIITKANGMLSVLINCFTYIAQNIIDNMLEAFLKPDINMLEKKQLYLMSNTV